MKLIRRIVGVLFLAMVLVAPGPAQADTAPGWFMATPAWDRQLQCDTQATCPRFLVLSDWIDASNPSGGAAVMDRETGLVWEQSPSTSGFTWENAQIQCNQSTVGNRRGWHLPTLQELASLVDPTATSSPALPAGHPFTIYPEGGYWTATSILHDAPHPPYNVGDAWYIYFGVGRGGFYIGAVMSVLSKISSIRAWCVRGGGRGLDTQ